MEEKLAVLPPALKDFLSRKDVHMATGAIALAFAAWGLYKVAGTWKQADGAIALRNTRALTPQEATLEKDFIGKEKIDVDFRDVGGLEEQIREIEELVLLPLSHAHLYRHSRVAQQPTGILLYGPPGTGKTLLAKAIAKSADASFLTVNVATLESKWFGETPKLIEAMFTLARKRAPCVMFIDEVDGFLSSRHESDMQHVNTMKTKFMEMWDGLATPRAGTEEDLSNWVLIIAATNKPWAIDPAVLRRMPRQIYVGLPDEKARASILNVMLRHERAEADVDIDSVAGATEGYSGSDLRELLRAASLIPIREALTSERAAGAAHKMTPRHISTGDLMQALRSVKPTGVMARKYKIEQSSFNTSFDRATSAKSHLQSTPKGASPHDPGASPSSLSPDTKDNVVKAFLEFGPSSKLNSANITKAVEESLRSSPVASHSAK